MQQPLAYLSGFANHFASEAIPGALPQGRNSPQRPAFGLYAEQLSGAAFTAPRAENRRSWLYRLRPSADHAPYQPYAGAVNLGGALAPGDPNRLRWDPFPLPDEPVDFIDGLATLAAAGEAGLSGLAAHVYCANRSMLRRVFASADGEFLLVPQLGALRLFTEMGVLEVAPGECAVIPRGLRFRVELQAGEARGYVCENHGALFRLPELGPIGANGLANPRDFLTPVAAFEEDDAPCAVILKHQGRLFQTTLDRSPLEVVAWHGNLAPYKYDLARFNVLGTVSFDHPDPSIFTVLTSPSESPGVANADFVIFPPRWLVAEDTFRPPWFHRNLMSELMGLIHGSYDAKAGGFAPGGASLHPAMSAHGPDVESWRAASAAALAPHKLEHSLALMFESRRPLAPSRWALESPALQRDYDSCWRSFPKAAVRPQGE